MWSIIKFRGCERSKGSEKWPNVTSTFTQELVFVRVQPDEFTLDYPKDKALLNNSCRNKFLFITPSIFVKVRQSSGSEFSLKYIYSSIFFFFFFLTLDCIFPSLLSFIYLQMFNVKNGTAHNSTSLISCIDHSDIIFNKSKKGGRTFYSSQSKILLSVCSFLSLYLQGFSLTLTGVEKFYESAKSSMQNLLQAADLRPSHFQGCQIVPRNCSLSNNFLFGPHQYQMQEICQCFLSYCFKLKSTVSHDWVEDPWSGSY